MRGEQAEVIYMCMTCACSPEAWPLRFRSRMSPKKCVTRSPRAPARGQSTQVCLRALLEREFRAERNSRLLESLAAHRSLDLSAEEVVREIRRGREDDA